MRSLIRLILAITVVAYPFVVYFGLLHFEFWQVSLLIIFIALMRLIMTRSQDSKQLKIGFFGAVLLLLFAVIALLSQQPIWFKFYPIVISLSLLYLFAVSLWSEKSMIQRFAEIREKNISVEKQLYMQKLTKVWCVFFMVNAAISSYTMLFSSDEQWMLYNGFISYVLMALLGLGELVYRHTVVMRRHP